MHIKLYPPQTIYELGQRKNQEDNIWPRMGNATVDSRVFILCDGMGGHEKGEVASSIVSRTMGEYLEAHADTSAVVSDETLLGAFEAACQTLDHADDGALKKMGTTLCLLVFHGGGATAMHIGDSRIYHIRPSEQRVIYQSRDHSLVYDLYQAGEISYYEMRTSPQKNIITRAIQPGKDNRVDPAIVHITDIRSDDYFYICSDGMLEQMNNSDLCHLLSSPGTDGGKRDRLVKATENNRDNHSAWLIHIKDVETDGTEKSGDEQTSADNATNIIPTVNKDNKLAEDVEVIKPSTEMGENGKSAQLGYRRYRIAISLSLCCIIVLLGIIGWLYVARENTKLSAPNQHPKTESLKDSGNLQNRNVKHHQSRQVTTGTKTLPAKKDTGKKPRRDSIVKKTTAAQNNGGTNLINEANKALQHRRNAETQKEKVEKKNNSHNGDGNKPAETEKENQSNNEDGQQFVKL